MKKNFIIAVLTTLFCIPSFAQYADSVCVMQYVSDSFTKHGIPEVFITLADTNGVLIDTLWTKSYGDKKYFWVKYLVRKPQTILVKAEHSDYVTSVQRLDFSKPGRRMDFEFPEMFMKRKMKETTLQEVTVKATRVQIAYKGDTIVVDAKAFKIPEGSMLDALVASVPGAELHDDGTIYMNGRKVDYLTLNGKDFFKGKNKMMLDNLPYYVVSKLKFYEKDMPHSQMIHQDTGEKDYVMDVEIKQEYSIGYTLNAEGGYGTDNRWLGRLFGLRFTDNSRLVLFANANNTNETRKPGRDGWAGVPRVSGGEKEMKMIGGNLNIDDKHGRFTEDMDASVSWTDSKDETRTSRENFLPEGSANSRSQDISRNSDFATSLRNSLELKKMGLTFDTNGNYSKQDGDGVSRSASFSSDPSAFGSCLQVLDSMFSQPINPILQRISINKVYDQSLYKAMDYRLSQSISWSKDLPWGDYINIRVRGDYDKSCRDNFSRYDLTYPNGTQADNRQDRFSPYRHHGYNYAANAWYSLVMPNYWFVGFTYEYEQTYSNTESNLYRLDWLNTTTDFGILPSQADYLRTIDLSNSYQSLYMTKRHYANIGFGQNYYGKKRTLIFRVNASVTNKGESVRYWRSGLRNDMQQCSWYLEPSALFRYSNKSEQSLWLLDNIYFNYDCNVQTPNPVQMLNIEDTSNPLAITKGNPNLKVARNHSINLNLNNKPWDKYFGISINMNFLDNMVANGFTYNPQSGVYTYRPENVKGNWNAFVGSLYRKALNKSQSLFMESRTSFNYAHNVDLAQVEGFNTSQLSRVNHYTTSQNLKVAYNKETTRVELIGDFSWNVAVREHMNMNNINAFNFSYGISGQYTFPWKIQLATDLKMYSRRGYEEPSMNTNEPVWNASLSRPFMKGNLIVKVDAFDILNQLSNTRYIVNGQGRTETWQLMMPRYAMLRIAYRFNKMPKKQK
ncbi:MAG: outer membrane beta-barrel family protein [Bacteroidaceae bacterium]|nr:outer membrane beta-barrel family protein [Bacteroidaceae bacterium]